MVDQTVVQREDYDLKNKRGFTIKCSTFTSTKLSDLPHPYIIYLHGNSSSRIEALQILKYVLPFGISICCFDFSGCGHSEGNYVSLGFYEKTDTLQVINDFKESKKN